MKILLINLMVYTTQTGRTEIVRKATIKDTMIYNFIQGFLNAGHEVTLAAGEPFRPVVPEKYNCSVLWFPLGFRKILPNGLMYPKGLFSYLKQHHLEYDMIISSDVFSFASLFAAMVCPEKLLIWHEPGKYHDKFHQIPAKLWYNLPVRWFIRKKVAVIARSEKARCFISQFCDRVSPEYIDHGINFDIFRFSAEKEKYFLIVAQLIPRKRVDKLILTFSDFLQKYRSDYHLYVAGDGEERERLEALIREKHLEQSVTLLGFQKQLELVPYLSRASGVLIDSIQEFSMVTIPEAVVCGTPVLTNSVPYPSAYVEKDQLGIVQDNWTADDMEQLLKNQPQYIQNCQTRREKMSNFFLARHMLELYQGLK